MTHITPDPASEHLCGGLAVDYTGGEYFHASLIGVRVTPKFCGDFREAENVSSEIDSAGYRSTFLAATSLALEPREIAGQQPGSLEQPASLGSGESF